MVTCYFFIGLEVIFLFNWNLRLEEIYFLNNNFCLFDIRREILVVVFMKLMGLRV